MSADTEFVAAHRAEQATIKRRRIPIACTTCRARKTRCDGNRPKCDCCVQMGEDCVYVQPHISSDPQMHASSLEVIQRLDKLEAVLRGHSESDTLGLQRGVLEVSSDGGLNETNDRPPSRDGSRLSATAFIPHSHVSAKRDYSRYQEDSTDGLAAVTAFSDDEDEPENGEGPYYGPSSNITLIRQISGALLRTKAVREWHQIPLLSDRGPRSKNNPLRGFPQAQNLEDLQNQAIDPYELPPMAEAHAYISHFFTQVALFLSCLHQKSFLETFRCHRANLQQGRPSSVSKVWLGILNLVFAISRTTMEGNTPDINKLAACEVFYQRAMKLGWERALRGRSVEIVQFLHLKSSFLQGTERSLDVWTAHSFAVNAAYSIGLHTAQSNSILSPLEKEVRLRTWYCLLIDDHTLSAAWGRPALTAGASPQIVTAINEDTGFYPASVPKHLSDMISSYLTSTVSLGLICQDAVNDLYDRNRSSSTSLSIYETISRTSEICWKINLWKESLPVALRPPIRGEVLSWEDGPDLHATRLRYFLSLRYHNLHITAYRAVLSRFLDDSPTSIDSYEPLRRIGFGLLQDCVHCCVAIMDHVQLVIRASEAQINLNGAWWLCSYYVFNASIVLCGIIISVPKHAEQNWTMSGSFIEDARNAFGRGVEVMRDLDRGSAIISRCRNVLNRFAELLDLSRMHEQRTTISINTDGTVASHQAQSHSNSFQTYPDQEVAYSNSASLDKDQMGGDAMIFRPNQGLERDSLNSFGFDGLDYLFENLGSENYTLNFI